MTTHRYLDEHARHIEEWALRAYARTRLAQQREQLYQQIRVATRGATRKEVQSLLGQGWTLLSIKMHAMREGALPELTDQSADLLDTAPETVL